MVRNECERPEPVGLLWKEVTSLRREKRDGFPRIRSTSLSWGPESQSGKISCIDSDIFMCRLPWTRLEVAVSMCRMTRDKIFASREGWISSSSLVNNILMYKICDMNCSIVCRAFSFVDHPMGCQEISANFPVNLEAVSWLNLNDGCLKLTIKTADAKCIRSKQRSSSPPTTNVMTYSESLFRP